MSEACRPFGKNLPHFSKCTCPESRKDVSWLVFVQLAHLPFTVEQYVKFLKGEPSMGPAAYWGLGVRALSSQLWTQKEAQGCSDSMGADENFEMRAVLQALVLAAFSPPRTPQTACPFVLNQPHKGLQDSETSRATAAIRLCPQLRGSSGLHRHCWTPPARRSPGARGVWALLGALLAEPRSGPPHHIPASSLPRWHPEEPTQCLQCLEINPLTSWFSLSRWCWAEGREEGACLSLWAPGMSGVLSPRLPLPALPLSRTEWQRVTGSFPKVLFLCSHAGHCRRFCGKLGNICSLVTAIHITWCKLTRRKGTCAALSSLSSRAWCHLTQRLRASREGMARHQS